MIEMHEVGEIPAMIAPRLGCSLKFLQIHCKLYANRKFDESPTYTMLPCTIIKNANGHRSYLVQESVARTWLRNYQHTKEHEVGRKRSGKRIGKHERASVGPASMGNSLLSFLQCI